MTREKEIDRAATHYGYGYNEDSIVSAYCCFRDGVKWADANPKSPWISVLDDLPCNHEDLLLDNGLSTKKVFILINATIPSISPMIKFSKWNWILTNVTHWMPIPDIPHEE